MKYLEWQYHSNINITVHSLSPRTPLVHLLSLCFVHLSNDWLFSPALSCSEDNLRSLLLIYEPFHGFNSVGPDWQKQMSHSQVLCKETGIFFLGPQTQQILFICSGMFFCECYFWSSTSFEPWLITSTPSVVCKNFLSHNAWLGPGLFA